jgi:molecular chaperone GrpE
VTKHKSHPKQPAVPVDAAFPGDPGAGVEGGAPAQTEAPADAGGALVELPEQAVQRLAGELAALKDRHLRLAAEFDNFKKRTQRERAEDWNRARSQVVANILDALDDLGRVAALDPERTGARDVLAGVQLLERKLLRELSNAGLERLGEEGETFDANQHEAVSMVPAASADQDHKVAKVLQPGYRFGGALLRPARVSVYAWHGSEPADHDDIGGEGG